MKKLMVLCIVALMAAFLVANTTSAQLAEVKVGKGDLKIGAILQAGFDYSLADDEGNVNAQFTLNRARLLFWGTIVPDKVKYFVQTEAKQKIGSFATGFEGDTLSTSLVEGSAVTTPYILDYKMIFLGCIPKTSITVGRFLPNFSLYMPAPTSKLDMINYPLFIINSGYNYAMWRQSGIQTATKTDYVDFNVGIFNGPTNNMNDNDDAKDVLLRAGFKPQTDFAKIKVGGYAWLGNLLLAEDADLAYNRFGFFGTLKHEQATVNAEFVMGSDEDGYTHLVDSELVTEDHKSMGFYGHVEYKVNPEFGILGRFDYFDPNTGVDDNAWTWVTLGVNHYIESYNAMIYLNSIMKLEQNDWGSTEKIKNDVIQLQFQIAP
ncbi:MAG: hypothetical protein ACE5OR_05050 [bacterium]